MGFYCYDLKNRTRSELGEERADFIFHFQVTFHHWGKSGQEGEAEIAAECCLLACHPGSSAQGRLHPSDLGPGILCFTTAGMKPHNQDNLEKKELNWAYTSRGLESMMVKQEHGRETAGNSQPDPPAKGRERSGGGGGGTLGMAPVI